LCREFLLQLLAWLSAGKRLSKSRPKTTIYTRHSSWSKAAKKVTQALALLLVSQGNAANI
jgi:hypothetical protein